MKTLIIAALVSSGCATMYARPWAPQVWQSPMHVSCDTTGECSPEAELTCHGRFYPIERHGKDLMVLCYDFQQVQELAVRQ